MVGWVRRSFVLCLQTRSLEVPYSELGLLQPHALDDLAVLHAVGRNDVEVGYRLLENEAGRVLHLHHPGTDVDARGYFYVEVRALVNELAKVRPECLLSMGEYIARIVLDNGVRAKAANNAVHVPCIHRVDKSLSDLYGVHERILLTTSGRLDNPMMRLAADRSKSDRRRNFWGRFTSRVAGVNAGVC